MKLRELVEKMECTCGCLTHSYGCMLKAPTCRRGSICERCAALEEDDALKAGSAPARA